MSRTSLGFVRCLFANAAWRRKSVSQLIFCPFRAFLFSASSPGLAPLRQAQGRLWDVFLRRFAAVTLRGARHFRALAAGGRARDNIGQQETLCQNRNIGSMAIRIAIAANAKSLPRTGPMRDPRKLITSGRDRYSLRLPILYRDVGNAERC